MKIRLPFWPFNTNRATTPTNTQKDKKMMNIDIYRLRSDLKGIEDKIRPVKEALRSTWTKPMDEEQYKLILLRKEATELLCLLAWSRGKSHLADEMKAQKLAERRLAKYQVEAA